MDDVRSYAKAAALGSTMEGGAVGRVIASHSATFETGDFVMGPFGRAAMAIVWRPICASMIKAQRRSARH